MPYQPREEDIEAVRQAVLDYVDAAYLVDSSLVRRSVRPDVAKLGFVDESGDYKLYHTSYAELLEEVESFNRDGRIPRDAARMITVFEVLDQTASAKLEAWWGVDYLHLAKYDGKWMIANVLWQTPPVPSPTSPGL